MDRLGLVKTDLRDYLRNKRKLCSEEPIHILSSQLGQAGCQLMTVHSVHCCLGTIPIVSPSSQRPVFNWLSTRTSEKSESRKKKSTKVVHIAATSVNMINKERDLFLSQRRRRGTFTPPASSPDPDYSPDLSQVLVDQEGAF